MPKRILDPETRHALRNAMVGLSFAAAAQEITRWAELTKLHPNTLYAATKDVRPKRSQRKDKGKRLADINHPMVKFAMEAVLIRGRLDPDMAIRQAEQNFIDCGCGALLGPGQSACPLCLALRSDGTPAKFPVSLGTFQRYLRRDYGIDRKQRRATRAVKPHRRFEAKAPMDIYQFDITGLKKRWYCDVTTRRILNLSELEVSENHPNENKRRQQLWSFHLVDDHSRRYYLRFIPCHKPDSAHVIRFLWEAFRELGIPKVLYTDNDPIIVSARMKTAAAVLDRYFEQLGLGGFKLDQHAAGNPQATGKVESAHRVMQKYWNSLGARFRPPTIDDIDRIAIEACTEHNWKIFPKTGEMPMIRFRRSHEPMRIPPPAILDSAFTAQPYRLSVTSAITISVDNVDYQLPRSESVKGPGGHPVANPFLNRAGKRGDIHKINVIWPPDENYFLAVADEIQFEIPRVVAVADVAGEYRSTAETVAQKTWKTLEDSNKDRKRAFRAAKRDLDRDLREGLIDATEHKRLVAEIDLKAPLLDAPARAVIRGQTSDVSGTVTAEQSAIGNRQSAMPAVFPRKRIETDPTLLAAAGGNVPPSMLEGVQVDYWTALGQLKSEGLITASEFDKAWLKSLFNGREEISERELRDALAERVSSPTVREGVA